MSVTIEKIASIGSAPQAENMAVLKAFLAATKDGFVFQNMKGEIADHNDAACRILRMTPDQLKGKTSRDPAWRAIREDGSPFPGELHPVVITLNTGQACYDVVMGIRSQSDDTRWIRVNSEPVRNESGAMLGAVACFSDITAEILMKKALARSVETQDGALMAARLRLQKLFFELAEPGHSTAAHLAIIKKCLEGRALPDEAANSLASLEKASESLMSLLYQLSVDAPAADPAGDVIAASPGHASDLRDRRI